MAAGTTGPPTADTALINGTMLNPSGTGGAYNKVTLTKGKKYRLRLINTSIDNHFRVSLDNHNLTVIQADFVPTHPYPAEWIFLAIGERYDVIIDANQDVDNYWFRAEVMTGCGANSNPNIQSIFSYAGAADALPTSTSTNAAPQNCNDETGLVPYVVKNVSSVNFLSAYTTLDVDSAFPTGGNLFQWSINDSAINVDWEFPTLSYVANGNTSYPEDLNILQLPTANTASPPIFDIDDEQDANIPMKSCISGSFNQSLRSLYLIRFIFTAMTFISWGPEQALSAIPVYFSTSTLLAVMLRCCPQVDGLCLHLKPIIREPG